MPQEENGVRGRRRRDASLPPPRRAKSQLLIPAEGVGDSIPPQHSHHGTFVFLISRKTRERGARRKRWFQKFDDHNLSFPSLSPSPSVSHFAPPPLLLDCLSFLLLLPPQCAVRRGLPLSLAPSCCSLSSSSSSFLPPDFFFFGEKGMCFFVSSSSSSSSPWRGRTAAAPPQRRDRQTTTTPFSPAAAAASSSSFPNRSRAAPASLLRLSPLRRRFPRPSSTPSLSSCPSLAPSSSPCALRIEKKKTFRSWY